MEKYFVYGLIHATLLISLKISVQNERRQKNTSYMTAVLEYSKHIK